MARLRLSAAVALALCCCCLIHAPKTTSATADASFPPAVAGLKVVQQDTRVAPPSSCGADGQAVIVASEADEAAVGRKRTRMDLELEDYPGSGANDRHSPWAQQRRN